MLDLTLFPDFYASYPEVFGNAYRHSPLSGVLPSLL